MVLDTVELVEVEVSLEEVVDGSRGVVVVCSGSIKMWSLHREPTQP